MTLQKKRYLLNQLLCPNCHKLLINHLPWELLSCYDKEKKWYREVLNIQ